MRQALRVGRGGTSEWERERSNPEPCAEAWAAGGRGQGRAAVTGARRAAAAGRPSTPTVRQAGVVPRPPAGQNAGPGGAASLLRAQQTCPGGQPGDTPRRARSSQQRRRPCGRECAWPRSSRAPRRAHAARPWAGGVHPALARAEPAHGQRRPAEEGAVWALGTGPHCLRWVMGRWTWGRPSSAR